MPNETLQTIYTRHSVRSFTGEPVSKSQLDQLLKAAMAAPSAHNTQPWEFIVVTDHKILLQLREVLPYADMLDQAGAAICVCGKPDVSRHWTQDCSAATENMLLAAHALGLGAVWTAVYPDETRVPATRKILGLPEDITPLNVIPLGIPKAAEKPHDKYQETKIHWEKW